MTHPNPIGIDPSTKSTGYAYRDVATRDWVLGSVPADQMPCVLEQAARDGVTHALIEDVYVDRRNFATSLLLKEVQTRIVVQLENLHVEPMWEDKKGVVRYTVPILTWKHGMLEENGVLVKGRDPQKARAVWVAKYALGAGVANDDEADAVCICEFARVHLERAARLEGR
ncbi:unnamed protein product [marine sediment metagenome]|uniref:Uncharacterized protein n=1 Tax=marine sediment metagenome TaxID=412755 RepID=X0UMN2_9ZZZZ